MTAQDRTAVPGDRRRAPAAGWRSLAGDRRVRFLLVGGFNTAFGFLLFVAADVLLHNKVDILGGEAAGSLVSLLISHCGALIVAFLLYRRFVFVVRGHFFRDLARFESVYLVALGLNAVSLPILVHAGVPAVGAQAGILGLSAILSYFGHRDFSFRRPRGDADPASPQS